MKKTFSGTFFAFVLAASSAFAGVIDTFDSISSGWTTDRKDPAVFQSTYFDGDYRLETAVSAADYNSASNFYNYQGKSLLLPTGSTEVSIQIYVSSDWKTSERDASLWLNGWDGTTDQLAWPSFGLASDGAGNVGWGVWNDDTGEYTTPSVASDFAYDAWHTLTISYSGGTITYYGDGNLIYTDTVVDSSITSFKGAYVQLLNFGASYGGVYWDNLTAVPEPSAIVALTLAGLGLAIGFRRKK